MDDGGDLGDGECCISNRFTLWHSHPDISIVAFKECT
jgi:hypothetical protein